MMLLYFLDFNPIEDPHVKKLETSANKTERASTATEHAQNSWNTSKHGWNSCRCKSHKNGTTELRNSPTSESAAAETLASANRDKEDLSTQDLTQGTEDIDDRNIRCQDPCMSLEALVQGTSTKRAEMTPVMLKSALPHEMQVELQDSLPLTPRLPIDGEPCKCKQEVADSTKPNVTDINSKVALGRDLAERVHIVDEGGKEHKSPLQLQQMKLLCGEIVQCNRNMGNNVPIANGLPLEGEWTVYASSEVNDLNGSANMFIAAIEHADGSGVSTETANVKGVKSESCERGTNRLASVDKAEMADAGTGFEVEPVNNPNELEMLITMLIQSEGPDSSDIPHICLRGMCWCVGDVSSPGCQTDESSGEVDMSQGLMDGSGAQMDAPRIETDGVGSPTDTLTGHGDAPSIETDTLMPPDKLENVSIPQKKEKLPDLPS